MNNNNYIYPKKSNRRLRTRRIRNKCINEEAVGPEIAREVINRAVIPVIPDIVLGPIYFVILPLPRTLFCNPDHGPEHDADPIRNLDPSPKPILNHGPDPDHNLRWSARHRSLSGAN